MTTEATATSNVWEMLSALVAYPRASPAGLLASRAAVPALDAEVAASLARFERAIADMSLTDLQECYSEVFDFGIECTLDLGWHLFGESRERGQFLSMLVEDLSSAGIARTTELPDHLTHVLTLAGCADYEGAGALAALVLPAVQTIRGALAGRDSVYAPLLEAIEAALQAAAGPEPV